MRALFTFQPGTGMFRPLVPLARALRDAGHEVAFASAASFRPQVEACGFELFPSGIDWQNNDLMVAFPDAPPPGPERLPWITQFFRVQTARAMVPDILGVAAAWKPDVLAGEILGLPHAVASAVWFRPQASFTEPHDEARRHFGLPPDPDVTSLYRYL